MSWLHRNSGAEACFVSAVVYFYLSTRPPVSTHDSKTSFIILLCAC
jgi:hypothetical protein